MSQHLLLRLWVDPLRADRLAARRPGSEPGREPEPPVVPPPWVEGRWRTAFGNITAAATVEDAPVPVVRLPAQRAGASTQSEHRAPSNG